MKVRLIRKLAQIMNGVDVSTTTWATSLTSRSGKVGCSSLRVESLTTVASADRRVSSHFAEIQTWTYADVDVVHGPNGA
jgi:hypothetical protein